MQRKCCNIIIALIAATGFLSAQPLRIVSYNVENMFHPKHDSIMVDSAWVEKDDWEWEREDASNGVHSIFVYNIDANYYEFGSGVFSIEDNVLWRAG